MNKQHIKIKNAVDELESVKMETLRLYGQFSKVRLGMLHGLNCDQKDIDSAVRGIAMANVSVSDLIHKLKLRLDETGGD